MITNYGRIFGLIVALEMKIFKKEIISKAIDSLIWVVAVIFVFSYLGPKMGISQEFIKINMIGTLATLCMGELYPNFVSLLSDLCGNRIISYYTILPVPYWMTFLAKMVNFSIINAVVGLFSFPIVKLLVPDLFVLSPLGFVSLFFVFMTACLLMGCFSFFIASFAADMRKIGTMWMRVVFPLWFLGGYQFTWSVLRDVAPWLARLNLLNPFTYTTEGFRNVFNQDSSIPLYICIIAMLLMTVLFATIGIIKMKRRLDCV